MLQPPCLYYYSGRSHQIKQFYEFDHQCRFQIAACQNDHKADKDIVQYIVAQLLEIEPLPIRCGIDDIHGQLNGAGGDQKGRNQIHCHLWKQGHDNACNSL